MKNKNSILWAIAFIAAGIILLLTNLEIIDFSLWTFWPAILIFLGLSFHVSFFVDKRRNPGILVPAGILTVYGCMFLYMQFVGWDVMSGLWPLFILGPGVGLLEMKLFSKGHVGSWVPVVILFTIGLFFLMKNNVNRELALSGILILVGVVIAVSALIRPKRNKVVHVNPNNNDVNVEINIDDNPPSQ